MRGPIPPGEWRTFAACLDEDPDLFFPPSEKRRYVAQIFEAQAVCGRCRVRRRCADLAVSSGEQFGVWGGELPSQRRPRMRAPKAVSD